MIIKNFNVRLITRIQNSYHIHKQVILCVLLFYFCHYSPKRFRKLVCKLWHNINIQFTLDLDARAHFRPHGLGCFQYLSIPLFDYVNIANGTE